MISPARWSSTSGRVIQTAAKRYFLVHPSMKSARLSLRAPRYRARMIDQGFCFNAGEWNFPDAPLRGLYARNRVYVGVTGMESFAPWLEPLENHITGSVLDEISKEIPPAWYDDDYDALLQLCEWLLRRRPRVPDLILEAKKSTRHPFPNWI